MSFSLDTKVENPVSMMPSKVASFWYRWHLLLLLLSSVKSVDLYKYSMKAFRKYFDCTLDFCACLMGLKVSHPHLSMMETCLLLFINIIDVTFNTFFPFHSKSNGKVGQKLYSSYTTNWDFVIFWRPPIQTTSWVECETSEYWKRIMSKLERK